MCEKKEEERKETKCKIKENEYIYGEIKCQLDATEVFIADLIACSTCCMMLQHPANRTHNPQLHTRPAT